MGIAFQATLRQPPQAFFEISDNACCANAMCFSTCQARADHPYLWISVHLAPEFRIFAVTMKWGVYFSVCHINVPKKRGTVILWLINTTTINFPAFYYQYQVVLQNVITRFLAVDDASRQSYSRLAELTWRHGAIRYVNILYTSSHMHILL